MVESRKLKILLVANFEPRKTSQIFFVEFIDERGQNDVERKLRFSLDIVHILNKFDKNIWLGFLSSTFATYQFLNLRDSTIASAISKIQALTLFI